MGVMTEPQCMWVAVHMTTQDSDAVEMAPACYSRHSHAMRLAHTSRLNVPSPFWTPLHPSVDLHWIAADAARGSYRHPPRRDHHRIAAGTGRRYPPFTPNLRRRDQHRIASGPAGAARQVTCSHFRRSNRKSATGAARRRPPCHLPSPRRPPPDRHRPRLSSRSRHLRPRQPPDQRRHGPPSCGPPPLP